MRCWGHFLTKVLPLLAALGKNWSSGRALSGATHTPGQFEATWLCTGVTENHGVVFPSPQVKCIPTQLPLSQIPKCLYSPYTIQGVVNGKKKARVEKALTVYNENTTYFLLYKTSSQVDLLLRPTWSLLWGFWKALYLNVISIIEDLLEFYEKTLIFL